MKTFTLHATGGVPHVDFSGDLNPEQLAVVKHAEGPSLVLAGAGSGKTRTIVYRVAQLLRSGVLPEHVLLLTFTNKAAREMLSRVEHLLGAFPARLTGGTFHHVANLLLRRYAGAAGFGSNFTILDQEDSRDLINACIKDAGIDTKGKRFPSASVLQSIWSYARNSREPFTDVAELRQPRLIDEVPKMEGVIRAYEDRKKAANAMDFDDLLVKLTELLATDATLRERASSPYRYVLVDEYQDTNRVQADMLRLLSSVHGNLLVVGDDAQSIYSFRAADIQNILQFPKRFPGARIFKLETNYRSTPEILHLANESIRWNTDQFPKMLRSARGAAGNGGPPAARSSPQRASTDGGVHRQDPERQANSSPGQKPERPIVVSSSTPDEEAQFIAEMILTLRDEGTPLSEIAVLFRATHHSQTLEFELGKRDIPYDYRGGIRFFERAHIKDVLSFLRIRANLQDEVSWLRVLRIQTGIGTETAGKLFERARTISKLEDILQFDASVGARAKAGWNDFSESVQAMFAAGDSPAECIRAIVKSPYGDYLDAEFPNAEERREDLEQLALFAEKYDRIGAFTAEAALHEGFAAERQGGGADEGEKVVLSTIHQAKGLEWDAVFVMHLFDGGFPNARAMTEEQGLEEERRLFYVACTRARSRLFLTHPIVGGGEHDYLHQPSQFLRELPEEAFERMEIRRETTVWKDADEADDTIELDRLGEVRPPAGDWRKRSFLRDV